jgi:hypothetical protein
VGEPILEIKVTGGDRLLAHWRDGVLYLLSLGEHESVGHYASTVKLESELANCKRLPDEIIAVAEQGFFLSASVDQWQQYANETDPQWLSHLDPPQVNAVETIFQKAANGAEPNWSFTLLAGGPGTGKTSILLSLADRAWDHRLVPRVVAHDPVIDYIESCLPNCRLRDLAYDLRSGERPSEPSILVVDDPHDAREIKRAKWLAQSRVFSAVVVGVDPLQLVGDFTDGDYRKLATGRGSEVIELSRCYRQKRNVGLASRRAMRAVAESSPFFVKEKKRNFAKARQRISALVNELEFPNKFGLFGDLCG